MLGLQLRTSLSSFFILLLIFEDSYQYSASITANPEVACVNDAVIVSCSLTADSREEITSSYTRFIVGSSNTAISESAVDGTGSHGGVNLAKLTATAPASSSNSAQATITLLSYTSSDNRLRLGCSNTVENGFTYAEVETLNIRGASPPSPPTYFKATFTSLTCSGTVVVSWRHGASDRAIERYILYENGAQIAVLSPTTSHSLTKTLQNNIDYTYSIEAEESCAGRSSVVRSNAISVGDPPPSPTSFKATFRSLTCSGTVVLSWRLGASDRAIERYILYENGAQIALIFPTTSYSLTKTLQNNIDYTYSIEAESCVGRSSAVSSNTISVGDPPSPPTTFRATFNSLTCSGTVVLSWTPKASDRAIERYILYENGAQIAVLNPANSYSLIKNLQANINYTYSIEAESCVGRSSIVRSNAISVDPPSPATSFTADLTAVNSDSCHGAIYLSWVPGDSDRAIDMYVLEGAELIFVTTNNYSFERPLQIDVDYMYSLVAISCAGESTVAVSNVIVEGYVLASSIILSYNQSNSSLTVNWSILPNTATSHPLLIDYSIDLFYNYTQSGDSQNYTDSLALSVLSHNTNYTRAMTPHSYENDYGVETAIRVCIQITQQCNQAFSGMTQCGEYSIVNPTTPKLTLPASPIPVADNILPVVIGSAGFIGLLSIILIVLLISIITSVYLHSVKKPKDTTPNTAIAPVQTFEGTNVNETSPTGQEHKKHPGYTPMSALPLEQLQLKPSSYANMSDCIRD